ncbi:hypothetical protein B0H13DRAFT_1852155 [Mycena leptocephala]|nr:hypothetical protein B0H13DRAFT_1852155 [Mycena leptocephala]
MFPPIPYQPALSQHLGHVSGLCWIANLQQKWLRSCATPPRGHFKLVPADGIEESKLRRIVRIRVQRNGRGRPRKVIEPVWLSKAVSDHCKITLQTLAKALGIHRNTLRNYLKQYGVYKRYSDLSDHDLDILTRQFKRVKPCGYERPGVQRRMDSNLYVPSMAPAF